MRTGVRLGVDVGKVRIGLAASDPSGYLASPVETIQRGKTADTAVQRILSIARERESLEIVVGLPLSLSGAETASTADARVFAESLAEAEFPVRLVDERLSTVSAQGALHGAGRNTRNSRSVVDQVAAVIILQHALDSERAAENPPGVLVEPT